MWIFFLDTQWNCSHQTIFTLLRACMHNKDYATQIKVKNEIFLQRRENQIESFCACVSLSYILCENFTLAWFLDPYDRVLHYLIRNFSVLFKAELFAWFKKKRCRGCCPKFVTGLNTEIWNVSFKLTLTDRNMEDRFCLKVSVYFWGYGIWVSSTSFQKSNIGWPQKSPTESTTWVFMIQTKNFFPKHQTKIF